MDIVKLFFLLVTIVIFMSDVFTREGGPAAVLYQLLCCFPPSRHVAALKQKGHGWRSSYNDPNTAISEGRHYAGSRPPAAGKLPSSAVGEESSGEQVRILLIQG